MMTFFRLVLYHIFFNLFRVVYNPQKTTTSTLKKVRVGRLPLKQLRFPCKSHGSFREGNSTNTGGGCSQPKRDIPSLKLTWPKRKFHLPTIHFQVLLLLVSGRFKDLIPEFTEVSGWRLVGVHSKPCKIIEDPPFPDVNFEARLYRKSTWRWAGNMIVMYRYSGDSWMYPYQRTPMGNPYISPI